MNITQLTSIAKAEEPEAAEEVGTAAAPRIVPPIAPHLMSLVEPAYWPAPNLVKTGAAARQSERDRLTFLDRKGMLTAGEDGKLPDPDLLLPRGGRAQRRALERAEASERRRMQRNYTRRQLRIEREASDLANLFDIVDRKVPASPRMRFRAKARLDARVLAVVEADRARYDREIEARQADRSLPAPQPVIGHDEVYTQLRASLKTVQFTQKTPKAAA